MCALDAPGAWQRPAAESTRAQHECDFLTTWRTCWMTAMYTSLLLRAERALRFPGSGMIVEAREMRLFHHPCPWRVGGGDAQRQLAVDLGRYVIGDKFRVAEWCRATELRQLL